jgi:hypothetical protein
MQMKKRIHMLTTDEYRRISDADQKWVRECRDAKYRKKYFAAVSPYALEKDEQAPQTQTKYIWAVLATAGMQIYGKPIAFFVNREEASAWADRENALCQPLPQPPVPHPPYPLGTYYAVETPKHLWEIRRIGKPVKQIKKDQNIQAHYEWSEKTVSEHQTKQDAKRALIRRVTKK